MSNPADTKYALVREVVEGTTVATPAFTFLDYIPGADFKLDTKSLSSDVMRQNRSMAGFRRTNRSASGSLKTHFRRDTAIDMLLESGMSGTWSGNVLKAGTTDCTHTIEKIMYEKGVPDYTRALGMMVRSFNLTVDASSNAEITFDMIGMNKTVSTSMITGATYTDPTQGQELIGDDVGVISIAGLNGLVYNSIELSVEHTREAKMLSAMRHRSALALADSVSRSCP
jgi:hypothetical protein